MKKNEYPMVELGTVLSLIRNGLSIKQSKDADGLPITRIETISNGEIDSTRVGYAGLTAAEHGQWLLKPGDVLLSHINSEEHLGKVAMYDGIPGQLIHGMNLLNLRADSSVILPRYLLRVLRSELFRRRVRRVGNRSVNQASVSITALSGIEIPLPPLPEQRRIADILDKADAIRRKRQEACALLDDVIRSEFLASAGDPFTNPRRFPTTTLDNVFDIRTGKLDANAAVADGKYPFFTCSRENFAINTYAFDCEALILSGNNASADYSVKHFSGKFNAYQRTYVLSLKDVSHSYAFFKQLLEYKLNEMKHGSRGTNTKYLTLEFFRRFELPVPPIDVQGHFERVARHKVQMAKRLVSANEKANDLFNSLVQRAFRGEL